jgi:hypothetical protein
MTTKPEALRLGDKYEVEGFLQGHRFAKNHWCTQAAVELHRLHTANEALRSGYDASRLEIESLRARVQELGQMLRENRSKRIAELEAQLEAIGAGGVEPLRRDHFRDATEMVPAGWAISYDGKTPHTVWTEGDGDLIDLEVKRQGGTACKMKLYAQVAKWKHTSK